VKVEVGNHVTGTAAVGVEEAVTGIVVVEGVEEAAAVAAGMIVQIDGTAAAVTAAVADKMGLHPSEEIAAMRMDIATDQVTPPQAMATVGCQETNRTSTRWEAVKLTASEVEGVDSK